MAVDGADHRRDDACDGHQLVLDRLGINLLAVGCFDHVVLSSMNDHIPLVGDLRQIARVEPVSLHHLAVSTGIL